MDLTDLRDGLNAAVPFNRHLGIELTALEPGRCEARLPDRAEQHNHIHSQHAGALFTLADAASGGALSPEWPSGSPSFARWCDARRSNTQTSRTGRSPPMRRSMG